MKRRLCNPLTFLCACVCLGGGLAHADLGDGPYRLPLIGKYTVYREDGIGSGYAKGSYRLVEEFPLSSGLSFGGSDIVPNVEQIAVVQKRIVGRAVQGLFVFDPSNPDPKPEFYDGEDKWRAALKDAGISGDVQLSNPDVLAALLPDTTLHPLDYTAMHGLLGFSDGLWSVIVQAFGVVIAFVIGLYIQKRQSTMMAAIVLGIGIDIVGLMVIAGEGGSAFVGLAGFPIFFCLIALAGRGVRRIAKGGRKMATA